MIPGLDAYLRTPKQGERCAFCGRRFRTSLGLKIHCGKLRHFMTGQELTEFRYDRLKGETEAP